MAPQIQQRFQTMFQIEVIRIEFMWKNSEKDDKSNSEKSRKINPKYISLRLLILFPET